MAKKKRKPPYSKRLCGWVLANDVILSLATLALCFYAVYTKFTGALPFLTALIGLYQAATGYVLGKQLDKAKAENTMGGIVYDAAQYHNFEESI